MALSLAYNLTHKFVLNEFEGSKIDVLDKSIASYNDFVQNRIAEASFYQGYLDSISAKKYADTILANVPLVERIVFSDIDISGEYLYPGFNFQNLYLSPKGIYQFGRKLPKDSILLYKPGKDTALSLLKGDEFTKMALKFASFIETIDTTRAVDNNEILKVFYTVVPGKISYMSIPRREDIIVFKEMLNGKGNIKSVYEQDILTYYVNPKALVIQNSHPELYQQVEIKPVFYDPVVAEPTSISTEIPLPGALAEYKIYYSSSLEFLQKEIHARFLPVAFGLSAVFVFLLLIAYLIFRNLNINLRMFKLQYDFINNLSHEFKTPVSVIKIAGNNIQSAKALSEKEKNFYGKILEEEADKLNNLLNTLLSFTQIENKAIKLKIEKIDLPEFCNNIVNSYRVKYTDFDIQYTLKNVFTFKSDITLLTSIFQNLIDNAYRYSYEGNKYMRISVFMKKRQIFFKFEDKGIGINASEKENIFKKFYRIQSEYNQQGSIGLGLAFCKEVIRLMRGDITVESKKGKGSTFMITLPYDTGD